MPTDIKGVSRNQGPEQRKAPAIDLVLTLLRVTSPTGKGRTSRCLAKSKGVHCGLYIVLHSVLSWDWRNHCGTGASASTPERGSCKSMRGTQLDSPSLPFFSDRTPSTEDCHQALVQSHALFPQVSRSRASMFTPGSGMCLNPSLEGFAHYAICLTASFPVARQLLDYLRVEGEGNMECLWGFGCVMQPIDAQNRDSSNSHVHFP